VRGFLAVLAAAGAAACAHPAPKKAEAPASQLPHHGLHAVLVTERGDITLRLFQDDAPKTVQNFVTLARAGAFDGAVFRRTVPGFMIQAGPTGAGGPLALEAAPGRTFAKEGRVAMAALQDGSDPRQFFITLSPAPWLDGKHAVFGEVTEGLAAAEAIASAPRQERGADGRLLDRPLAPILLRAVRVEDRP
jgi:cyclophilin family peptidyl-prolyl cis-trans isomerase